MTEQENKPGRRLYGVMWRTSMLVVVVLLLLKWGVVDGYEVRGNSMEPLLRDRADGADRIFVFKPYYQMFEPKRFGLAVFERPESLADPNQRADSEGDLFVKRVAGFPGEQVQIRGGDLFVKPVGSPETPERPVFREIPVLLAMLQQVAELDPAADSLGPWSMPDTVRIEGGAVEIAAGSVRYDDLVRDDWIDEAGEAHMGGSTVNDVALRFRVRLLDPQAEVVAELLEAGDTFTACLSGRQNIRLVRRRGPVQDAPAVEAPGSRLAEGREVLVLFANVDNRLILTVDEKVVLDEAYDENTPVVGPPRNGPSVSVAEGRAVFSSVEILRDVHYTDFTTAGACDHAIEEPYSIPEGGYFLLGDNSYNSRDSRHFGSVARSGLVGRPFLIFHPFGRIRIL